MRWGERGTYKVGHINIEGTRLDIREGHKERGEIEGHNVRYRKDHNQEEPIKKGERDIV